MKRFKSILCTSALTLAMCSVAFAGSGRTGDISGRTGDISGRTGDISGRAGDISGRPGDISGRPGDISGLPNEIYAVLMGLLGGIVS